MLKRIFSAKYRMIPQVHFPHANINYRLFPLVFKIEEKITDLRSKTFISNALQILEDEGQDEDDIGDGYNKETKYVLLTSSWHGKAIFCIFSMFLEPHLALKQSLISLHNIPAQATAHLLGYG